MRLQQISLVDFDTDFFEDSYLYRLKSLTEKLIFIKESDIEKRNSIIKNSEALLIWYSTSLDKTALINLQSLKYIGASSVAVDQVDVKYAHNKGIIITNIPGYSNNP